jgi:type I restriction enzyme S subunit
MQMNEAGVVDAGRQRSPHLVAGKLRPYLRVANVMDGYIDASDVNSMLFTDSEFERFKLRTGDILLNEGQSLELVGRPAIYKGIPANCCFQNTLIRFRSRNGTDAKFALQLFKHLLITGRFSAIASQTTSIAHLGVSRFAGLKAAFPPLLEQKKIAAILGSCDSAIEKVQALLALKSKRLLGLRWQLLNGTRRFSKYARGKWHRYQLSEVLKHVFRPVDWSPSAMFRLVSIRRRCGGLFRREDLLGADYKTTDLHEIRTGDFLVSKRQVVHGAWAMVTKEFSGCHVSKEYSILVNKAPDVLHMPFFDWLSHEQRMWHLAFLASDGVHREKLIFDSKDFLRHYIELPPTIEEQQRIVQVLDACDRELRLLEAELEALKLQKRGLMQKLLTGKIRVKT